MLYFYNLGKLCKKCSLRSYYRIEFHGTLLVMDRPSKTWCSNAPDPQQQPLILNTRDKGRLTDVRQAGRLEFFRLSESSELSDLISARFSEQARPVSGKKI